MKTEAFDYFLPDELIAQSPAVPRESCRLMVLQRARGTIEHRAFVAIPDYVNPGDLLVLNDTKVMPGRLIGRRENTGSVAEILLLRRRKELDRPDAMREQYWEALVKPGRRLKPGSRIVFENLVADIIDWGSEESRGDRVLRLSSTDSTSVGDAITRLGSLPLPPYIKSYCKDTSLYQTVYAREQNSAAAPTAGLHFSEEQLREIKVRGSDIATVCLEIGLDTFRKVEEEFITDHHIHSEAYSLSEEVVASVARTKERGGRVIAVGTTAVRALESAADAEGNLRAVEREQTSLYILPGYTFKVVDALLTNFHTPRSTLLMLVAAFAGYETMREAYRQALEERYRFLSFGDAMLIV